MHLVRPANLLGSFPGVNYWTPDVPKAPLLRCVLEQYKLLDSGLCGLLAVALSVCWGTRVGGVHVLVAYPCSCVAICTGQYYPLDLLKPPFNVSQPLEIFDEQTDHGKHMLLFDVQKMTWDDSLIGLV